MDELNEQNAIDVGLRRRARELELDVMLAHELASLSPAARRLWEAVGQEPPSEVTVSSQGALLSGGRMDVEACDPSGRRLLVENKAGDGHFQPGQVEAYRREAAQPNTWVVLVAPDAYRADDWVGSLKAVTVEELAGALEDAASALNLAAGDAEIIAELRLSYLHRARALREYAEVTVRA